MTTKYLCDILLLSFVNGYFFTSYGDAISPCQHSSFHLRLPVTIPTLFLASPLDFLSFLELTLRLLSSFASRRIIIPSPTVAQILVVGKTRTACLLKGTCSRSLHRARAAAGMPRMHAGVTDYVSIRRSTGVRCSTAASDMDMET